MVTSTGTFVSCKDYDDDIDGINKELSEIKSQIKELQDKVNAGKYVTNVAASTDGLTVTFNDGTTSPIKLNGAATTLTLDAKTGEFSIDGKATGLFATNGEEGTVLVPYVNEEDGYWYFYNKEGKAEKSAYKAAGNAYAVVADGVCTLNIPDAEGKMQTVKLPTMAAAITSLKLARIPANGEISAPMAFATSDDAQMRNVAGTKWAKKAVVSTYNSDGTKGVYVDVVIEPTNIDVSELTFTLQNSKGVTVFADGVVTEAPVLTTRAAGTGVHRIYFAYKDGLTKDDLTGDNAIVTENEVLAVACGNVSTAYELKETAHIATPLTSASATVTAQNSYVKLGEKYSIFGKGYSSDPSKTGATAQDFLTAFTGVTDYKLSVDETVAKTYGVTVDGDSFTVSGADAYEAVIPLTITYTSAASTGTSGSAAPQKVIFNVTVQTKPVVGAVTLKASHVLSTAADAKYAYIPLADLANAITGADKIEWNKTAVAGLTYKTIVKNAEVTGVSIQLTSSKKYSGANLSIKESAVPNTSTDELIAPTLVKANKENASTLAEAAYIKVEINPANANVTADVYSGLIEFNFGGKKAQATVELTLTNPATLVRISSLFDGDNVVAYGTGNSANGEIFNVLSVYNTVGVTFGNNPTVTVASASGKTNWTLGTYNNGVLNVTIPSKEQMYTDTRKVTVQYNIFDGSTNNIFKDEIYVTGKSPIKEGTIEALKTTLSLGQAKKATFTNADFTAKDVWGTAYNLFGTETLADATTTPATAWKWDAPATAKIQNVDVTANTSLVTIDKTYRTTKDGSTVETTKDYTTMTGFTVTVANDAALQAGDKVKVTVKITDQWGMEFTKDVEITVVK